MAIHRDLRFQWDHGGTLIRLILVNVLVFAVLRVIDLLFFLFGADGPDLARWLMSTSDPQRLLRTPWTVVTYMFTHWDLFHIFFNMLVLWFIGRIFEDLLGGKRLLGNYLLGGFMGLLLYILSYNFLPAFERYAQGSSIMGASGAVMAVFVGLATYRPDLQVHLLFFGAIRLKWLAMIYVVVDLIGIRQGGNSGGHIAHLGGALYGYIAAQQLKQGRDLSLGLALFLDRISNLFRKRNKPLKVAKRPSTASASASRKAGTSQDQQARIDAILDKIGRSGYDSLTKEEKDFLFKASK